MVLFAVCEGVHSHAAPFFFFVAEFGAARVYLLLGPSLTRSGRPGLLYFSPE